VQRKLLRITQALATLLCFAFPTAWAAGAASDTMYFYCYGPQTQAGELPAPKVYLSGVSPSVYTDANRDAASNEFRQFIASKYGADFEPRCEFSGTELAATKLLSLLVSRYRTTAVKTGWTWAGAASADAH
jgi:hypothetical protein